MSPERDRDVAAAERKPESTIADLARQIARFEQRVTLQLDELQACCQQLQTDIDSERQVLIELVTNLVQSLGDQINTVAQNIGH